MKIQFIAKALFSSFLLLFLLVIGEGQLLQAQKKNDYIVIKDSLLTHGYIKSIPIYPSREVLFKQKKKEEFQVYAMDEVSEFQERNLLFQRKAINVDGRSELVFLELLGDSVANASFWKLNAETNRYYIQTPAGITELRKDTYKSTLTEIFTNPDWKYLIEITPLWELPLEYFSQTVNTWDKPRSFTKFFRISPFIGLGAIQTHFQLDESNTKTSFSVQSPQVGIVGEFFLGLKRNISITAGINYSDIDGQGLFRYGQGSLRYESDVYMDYSLIQVPLGARYYRDIKPNDLRVFGLSNYSLGLVSMQNAGMFVAELTGNEILTYERDFEFSKMLMGLNAGIGVEKYLSAKRSLTGTIQFFQLNGNESDQVSGINLLLGFKF